MAQYSRPHSYIAGGTALTGTSIDDLIRPGLRVAFPLPSEEGSQEDRFRRLLDALAQRNEPRSPADGRASLSG